MRPVFRSLFALASVLSLSAQVTKADEAPLTPFALNVTRHVLYHEIAHALIREFDLPVLANEEAMADTFATLALTPRVYEEGPQIILDRVQSWMLEHQTDPPNDAAWASEHPPDLRRAYQTACLFYGLDPAEFAHHMQGLSFSQRDLANCSDTAPDQAAGWARILAPLTAGPAPERVEVIFGEGPLKDSMRRSGLFQETAQRISTYTWPNKITLHFDHCDQGAYWSRTTRTILICDDYVTRFIAQGRTLRP